MINSVNEIKMKDKTSITVYLDKEEKEQLKEASDRHKESLAQFVRKSSFLRAGVVND